MQFLLALPFAIIWVWYWKRHQGPKLSDVFSWQNCLRSALDEGPLVWSPDAYKTNRVQHLVDEDPNRNPHYYWAETD